jgi:hypothetical protein
MKIMSDEKGFITVFLLAMIFIIVTIMGAGIVFINNGNKRAWSTARSNQALYLAEAGLEKAIQDLKNPSANWASLTSVPETDFPSINPIGKYKVEFGPLEQSEPGIDKRILHSTGIVQSGNRKITETISIEVTKIQPSPTPPEESEPGRDVELELKYALFTYNNIHMGSKGSSRIIGDVATNSTAPNSVYFPWSAMVEGHLLVGPGVDPSLVVNGAQPNPEIGNVTLGTSNLEEVNSYPEPVFPEFPTDLPTRSSITLQGSTNGSISEDGYYPNITIQDNTTLTIDIPEGTERKIVVDTLDMPVGNIIINGSGKLILYVKNENGFTLPSSSKINYGSDGNGDPNQVLFYFKGPDDEVTTKFSVLGDAKIHGTVFVKKADLKIDNSGGIKGHIITGGNNVSIAGDGSAVVKALYAPNANVSLTNSGSIYGAVVAKNFSTSGNSRIFYDSSMSSVILPIGGGSGPGGPTPTPGPTPSPTFEIRNWRSSGFELAE